MSHILNVSALQLHPEEQEAKFKRHSVWNTNFISVYCFGRFISSLATEVGQRDQREARIKLHLKLNIARIQGWAIVP